MSMKSILVFVAIAALVGVASASCRAQTVDGGDAARWKSFGDFVKAVGEFPAGEIPFADEPGADTTGARVGGDKAVMKRFGGTVEFEGVFEGIVTVKSLSAPGKKTEKIDITMPWPAARGPNTTWTLHLYPKTGSLKAWKALAPKTPVKFRAVVTGISMTRTFISGVDLQAYSILLEEGEVIGRGGGGEEPRKP